MKKIYKRVLAVLLALSMVCALPADVLAAEVQQTASEKDVEEGMEDSGNKESVQQNENTEETEETAGGTEEEDKKDVVEDAEDNADDDLSDDEEDSGEVDLTEEAAEDLVTDIFGEPLEEGVKTDEGYQYIVPNDALNGLIQDMEDMYAEETGEIPEGSEGNDPANELPEDYVDDSNEQLYQILEEMSLADSGIAVYSEEDVKVEVVFVIDSTGSMSGEITAVKNNVADFARYLSEKNLSLRLGLIDYRDIIADGAGSTVVHSADYSNWMNVTQFITALTEVRAGGGGDSDETPIDALAHLTEGTIPWSSDAYKFAILITDAGYKESNNHGIGGMDDMITRLQNADVQVSTITPSSYYSEYGNLAGLTGGIQGNLNGDFSEILRDYAEAVVGGARPTQDYSVRITEETTGLPVQGAVIGWSDGSASATDRNGLTVVTSRNNPLRSVYISCAGYNPVTFDELELLENGCINITMTVNEAEAAEAEDGVPVLSAAMFQKPKAGSGNAEGPYIEILGKRFNLLSALSFTVDMDPFGDKVNISHNKEEKKYEVIIGKGFEGASEDNRGYWEDSYSQFKALAKDFAGKSGRDIYNTFRSLRKIAKSKEDLLLPFDSYVGGYAEASYASGELKLVEGGIVIGASLELESPAAPLPPAPYIFFKASFTCDAKAGFTLVSVETTGKLNIGLSKTEIEVSPNVTGTVNLGVDKLASVGGGLKGGIQAGLEIPFTRFSDAVNVKLNGSFVLELCLLGFKFSGEFPFGSLQIYPGEKSRQSLLMQGTAEDFELISRPAGVQSFRSTKNSEFLYQKGNTYADNGPQLVRMNDGSWLMVWVDAARDRSDNDMTALYYTVSSDGRSWSEPVMVDDDGTGDFMPSLALAGDGTPVLVWQDSIQEYGDAELNLETRAKDIMISAAVFDTEEKTFGEPVSVTSEEDQSCEMALQLTADGDGAAVYWLENSENSLLLASGENKIFASVWDREENTWSEPQMLVDGLGNLTNFSAGEIGGQPCVAYSLENEDAVYYRNRNGSVSEKIYTVGVLSKAEIESGRLYWSDESGLCSWDGSGKVEESESLASTLFDIIQYGDTRVAAGVRSEGITNELWVSVCSGGDWSEPVQLTEYGMSIDAFSPVLTEDGLYWAAGRTEVDGGSAFGASDLIVDSTVFRTDIVVEESAVISEFEDTSDGKRDILIDISNQGTADGESLKALFFLGEDFVGESALYVVDEENPAEPPAVMSGIKAGGQLLVVAEYQLPEEQKEHVLEIRITSQDGNTVHGSAHVTIPAPAADLTVNDVNAVRVSDGAVITAVVKNEGGAAAEKVAATLRQEDVEGTQAQEIGTLQPGAEKKVEFKIAGEALSASGPYDYKRFIVDVKTDSYEAMTGNNSGGALLAPIEVEGIRLTGEKNISLAVGERHDFAYEILPAEAPDNTVTWMSDNTALATVYDGEVLALQPGQVTITVLTANEDGEQFTDSAVVTISGDSNVGITGLFIETDKIEIPIGKTREVAAQIQPENASNRNVSWTVDNESILQLSPIGTGEKVQILGLAEGTATVVARTEDGGYSDSVEVKITQEVLPAVYSITVQNTEHGTVTSQPAEAQEGDTVSLTVSAESGYVLSSLSAFDEAGNSLELTQTDGGYTFVMPSSNVVVHSSFETQKEEEKIYYTLTFESDGGTEIQGLTQAAGTVVSLDGYRPEKTGYTFEGWYLEADLTTKAVSVTLNKNITVYAKWNKAEAENADTADREEDGAAGGGGNNSSGQSSAVQTAAAGNPETGDGSLLEFWALLGILAVVSGCVAIIGINRKKNRY